MNAESTRQDQLIGWLLRERSRSLTVQRNRYRVEIVLEELCIGVERHGRACVPEHPLNRFHVGPGADRKRRGGVAQVVGSDARHDRRRLLTAILRLRGRLGILRADPLHDPLVANMTDLHKIGFSTTSVEQRIKNAEKSPTYLMAPVKVLADYRLYNTKASWLEHLLHKVFAEVRLDLTQVDKKGRDYDPSEWFVVPLAIINQAVAMIMSGEITEYVYDKAQQRLVRRS